jgi:hypothetical protein
MHPAVEKPLHTPVTGKPSGVTGLLLLQAVRAGKNTAIKNPLAGAMNKTLGLIQAS